MKNKNKKKSTHGSGRIWPLELIVGILLIGSVFFIAAKRDMAETESHLSSTVNYVKEQCNRYTRMNLASETKSLMRIIQSARQVQHRIASETERDSSFKINETFLEECVKDSYVTGAVILDKTGAIQEQYQSEQFAAKEANKYLDTEVLLSTAQAPEKTYSVQFQCKDGSYVDLAAAGLQNGEGIVVVYYHIPKEYMDAFNLSVDSMLSGYNLEHDGTIVVSKGSKIISSNDESLMGRSTDEIEILRKIKARVNSDTPRISRRKMNSCVWL